MKFAHLSLPAVLFASSVLADSAAPQLEFEGDTFLALVTPEDLSVKTDFSYSFESDFNDPSLGAFSASYFNIAPRVPFLLTDHLRLQAGISYRRIDFDSSAALVPEHMQGLAGLIGLEYLIGDQPVAGLRAAPGFYFIDNIDSDSFDVPTIIYSGWRFRRRSSGWAAPATLDCATITR